MQQIKAACVAGLAGAGLVSGASAVTLEPVTPQPSAPLTYVNVAYTKVPPAEAKRMMEAGVPVIDVREPQEFEEERIAGSINVPLSRFRFGMRLEAAPDLEKPVLIVCRSGVRAERAARVLVESGYQHIYNMYGTTQWPYGLVH